MAVVFFIFFFFLSEWNLVSVLVILSGRPGEGRTPRSLLLPKGFLLPETAAGGKWAPREGERGGGDLAAVCSYLLLPAAPSPDF